MDKLIVIGNLGRDPEMRYMQSGKPVTNFSVASNHKWTGQDGETHEETTWIRVSVFGRMAEVCNEYLSKGRQVYVEGRLRADSETGGPRVYEKRDGGFGAAYEMVALTVQFLGGRSDGGNGGPGADSVPESDEEIPF
jgi:single-strand DNA-binding protein